jgi:glucose/mannose-6-phosphate isomerase
LALEEIQKIDSESMYARYDEWPKIAEESYNKDIPKVELRDIDHVVFAGMGGSGTIGDIFSSILSKRQIHVTVVKGYHLPKTVNDKTLVVCTSVSGNTNETLSILDECKNSKGKFIAFSSGGMMEEFCKKNTINHYKIQKIHSPRVSCLSFLYSTINALEEIIPINKFEIKESIDLLNQTKNKIDSKNLNAENQALSLAEWIDKISIIYYPWGLQSAAIRFKNSMQENAKKHVLFEDVIEASHNGIVSWETSSIVQPILMQGKDDHYKTRERWKIIKEFFLEKEINYKEIFSVDGSILSKLVCLIYTLDMTSIYNAAIGKVDPSPVNSIDFVKKRL